MSIEKVMMAVIGVGMITTLILPGRQTPQVINALSGLTSRTLGTAMGTYKVK